MTIGVHVLGTLHGCPKEFLEKVNTVRDIIKKTASEANFHVVGESFKQFEPFGVTGVLILSESHFSIHTWPEKETVAVDIFTCGKEGNAEKGFDILCKYLKPKKIDKKVLQR